MVVTMLKMKDENIDKEYAVKDNDADLANYAGNPHFLGPVLKLSTKDLATTTAYLCWVQTILPELVVIMTSIPFTFAGFFTGDTVLRLAKDLAENNAGACVLVVCSEITVVTFRGSSDTHLDSLVGQALFGDGAAAVIVGADPDAFVEPFIVMPKPAAQFDLAS
ncbi:hypothetical protein RJ640_025525 [Escallonia rubra]|uniref:Chalcone/stilbene synthase N-terminal domain-containing protein n=1 Tax=Escallonia rubra TaxID=112253 RepID=A0AA88S0Y8_9ASTE|nr:hypothetical protein RJ640_025525 [Escallonia rubra]